MKIKNNYKFIILFLIIIFFVLFNSYSKVEGFYNNNNNNKWSSDLIRRFNIYQSTVNLNNYQFDMDIIQKQASPEEAEHLLKTGYWPWPDDLKYMYMDKVWSNPIIKILPQYALDYAMKIYNKNAAIELLAWNAKEGQFLLYGGNIGKSNVKNINNTIQCTNDKNGNSVMEKKTYTGMNLWNGYMNTKTEMVKDEDIPNTMPGFSFVKGPCNPCVALDSQDDYNCPFKLNVKGDDNISSIWKKIWSL